MYSVMQLLFLIGSGMDFNSNPFNITINPEARYGRANISITCDHVVEELKIFALELTLTSDIFGVTLGGRYKSEGKITKDIGK